MPWSQRRLAELPPDWEQRRSRVLRRDPLCQIQGPGCLGESTEVDHRLRLDHSERSLRGVCRVCHARRTSAQGHKRRAELRAKRLRPRERHPGTR